MNVTTRLVISEASVPGERTERTSPGLSSLVFRLAFFCWRLGSVVLIASCARAGRRNQNRDIVSPPIDESPDRNAAIRAIE